MLVEVSELTAGVCGLINVGNNVMNGWGLCASTCKLKVCFNNLKYGAAV